MICLHLSEDSPFWVNLKAYDPVQLLLISVISHSKLQVVVQIDLIIIYHSKHETILKHWCSCSVGIRSGYWQVVRQPTINRLLQLLVSQ